MAVFTDMFLYGIIVPVIPFAIQTRSHVEDNRVQHWVTVLVAVYGAALLAFSPICGWLADRGASRRLPLLLGLFALLGSTALLNVGNSIGLLAAGRIWQGASAAVVWVVGLALLADTVPQQRLATATGWLSIGMSLGLLLSPLLGGVVYDHAGYNAVFAMAYALIGVDIVLRLLLIEKKVAARWDPEAGGRVAVTASHAPDTIVPSVVEPVHTNGTDDAKHSLPTVSPPAQTEGSLFPRRRRRDRLPPVLSLLCSCRLLAALFCALVQAALVTAFDSVLTIHAANIFDWTSTGAALLFLPLVIPTFAAPLFGWLIDKLGGRYFVVVGFVGAAPPLVCLRFVKHNSIGDKVLLCVLLAVVGLSFALTFPPIMAEISGVVDAEEKRMLAHGHPGFGNGGAYAQAYALFNMAFAAGCMIGPLLAGFIVDTSGWATMAWVLGLLAGFSAVPAFLWLGGWFFKETN